MKYKMHYLSGAVSPDGTHKEEDGGEWEIKETPKSFMFTCLKDTGTLMPLKCRIPKDNRCIHSLQVFGDMIIVYPFREGVPYIFTKHAT